MAEMGMDLDLNLFFKQIWISHGFKIELVSFESSNGLSSHPLFSKNDNKNKV